MTDQSLSKYLGLSSSDLTPQICLCKQHKLRQLLHPTGPCRAKTGVLLKASTIPLSADIYRVTSFSLGNMKHMAMFMLGTACWKLSALKLNMLLGVSRAQWGVSNPALETQQRCIPTDVCKQASMRSTSGSQTKALNPLQIDSPKALQIVCCASSPLNDWGMWST